MNLLLQITCHPQAEPHIKCCLLECSPALEWTLARQAEDSRLWLLTLSADPCGDPIQKIIQALMINNWVIGVAFSSEASSPAKDSGLHGLVNGQLKSGLL
jgi:hypothetical protein